ncbi:MAG: hypothetical protein U1F26_10965 [Lysobacterales bacterium]
MHEQGYRLQSELFTPEAGEDAETNPGVYGKALARWIADGLQRRGVAVAGVVAEDWGWCVLLASRPYRLWIGCGNVQEEPSPDRWTWYCSVHSEVPFWTFWVKWTQAAQIQAQVAQIDQLLAAMIAEEPRIQRVAED